MMVRLACILLGLAVLALGWPLPAAAVEYRLRVADLYEDAFYALLGPAGTREGPVQGPSRLIGALDTGQAPAGVLLYDRPLEGARDAVARMFGGVRVRATEAPPDGEVGHRWSEVRWEGDPGEQSVWVIAATRTRHTEVRDVALKGTGPLVRAIPHLLSPSHPRALALGVPLGFIQGREGDPAVWKRLSPVVDLSDGVAVVVGVNSSSGFADHVFIVVKHAPAPTTYHVVLAWRERLHEIEVDGDPDDRRNR